jgi:hypothetical protein
MASMGGCLGPRPEGGPGSRTSLVYGPRLERDRESVSSLVASSLVPGRQRSCPLQEPRSLCFIASSLRLLLRRVVSWLHWLGRRETARLLARLPNGDCMIPSPSLLVCLADAPLPAALFVSLINPSSNFFSNLNPQLGNFPQWVCN